jgi:hypothetical protein
VEENNFLKEENEMKEEIQVEAISFGEVDSQDEGNDQDVPDFSPVLAEDNQEKSVEVKEENPEIPDFSNVLAEDEEDPEQEQEEWQEQELKSQITPENASIVDLATEKLRKIEEDEAKKEKEPLKDIPLEEIKVEKIVGFSGLQPIAVYAKVEGKEEPIGFPGFFDERNQIFMMAEVGPVSAQGFNEIFSDFLKDLALKKKENTGGESDEKN